MNRIIQIKVQFNKISYAWHFLFNILYLKCDKLPHKPYWNSLPYPLISTKTFSLLVCELMVMVRDFSDCKPCWLFRSILFMKLVLLKLFLFRLLTFLSLFFTLLCLKMSISDPQHQRLNFGIILIFWIDKIYKNRWCIYLWQQ